MAAWVECVDYSYSHPDPAGLRAAGIEGVLRYQPGAAKGLTAAERDALWAAGLWIRALYESTADRALAGFAAGQADARAARAAWRSVGYPDDLPIIFAVDIDATRAQLSGPVQEYFRGIATVEAGDEVYGGIATVDYLTVQHLSTGAFQTYAWSSGRWDPSAEFEQYDNGVTIAGGVVDRCRALSTARFWEAPMTAVDLTDAAVAAVAAAVWATKASDGTAYGDHLRIADLRAGTTANTEEPAEAAAVAAVKAELDALKTEADATKVELDTVNTALAGLPAAVVAALPAPGPSGLTAADVQAACQAALSHLGLTVTA